MEEIREKIIKIYQKHCKGHTPKDSLVNELLGFISFPKEKIHTGKMFPISTCCNASVKEHIIYTCEACGQGCKLSKDFQPPIKEEIRLLEINYQQQNTREAQKINEIIMHLNKGKLVLSVERNTKKKARPPMTKHTQGKICNACKGTGIDGIDKMSCRVCGGEKFIVSKEMKTLKAMLNTK